MKPGSILYNGHVVNKAEAAAYNQHQDECDRYLKYNKSAMKRGTLSNKCYNNMLDRKHRMLIAISKGE